jgi:hypothetical protein
MVEGEDQSVVKEYAEEVATAVRVHLGGNEEEKAESV